MNLIDSILRDFDEKFHEDQFEREYLRDSIKQFLKTSLERVYLEGLNEMRAIQMSARGNHSSASVMPSEVGTLYGIAIDKEFNVGEQSPKASVTPKTMSEVIIQHNEDIYSQQVKQKIQQLNKAVYEISKIELKRFNDAVEKGEVYDASLKSWVTVMQRVLIDLIPQSRSKATELECICGEINARNCPVHQ